MKQKIKVLHVIGGGEFGGAEQYLITLLKAMNKQEFSVEVVCLFSAPLAARLAAEHIPHQVFAMANKGDLTVIPRISRYIKERGFNIVHTHGVRANLIGRLAARQAGIKSIITTVHSVLEFDYPRKKDLWINKISEKLTARLTKHYIAVSEDLARYVRESYKINKRRVSVVHNGLELSKYRVSPNEERLKREFGINKDDVVIGIVSRLHLVKGHRILFYAMQHLVKDFPFLKLLVIGSGPEEENLRQQAKELGISQKVVFAGFRKDIPAVLGAMDIVVQPSLSEGFGLTVIEAMAMGKPVVASAVGGIREIIKDRQNGLLVPAGDPLALAEAVTSLLELPGRTKEIARAGQLTVELQFTAVAMARKTEEVYNKLTRRYIRNKSRNKGKSGTGRVKRVRKP